MSRRRTRAAVSSHNKQSTNNVIWKLLGALAVLWLLFLLWRLVFAPLVDPDAVQAQPSKLRSTVRSSVQKILIDNRPGMRLYNVEHLLVFPADDMAGEESFLQAAVQMYKAMESEQQATSLFVCLPPLLSGQALGSGYDFSALRKQLITAGVHEWQIAGDGRQQGLLEAVSYLRHITEAVQELYAPRLLSVHLFDHAGSARSGLGKAANWVFGLMPSLTKHVAVRHHLVPLPADTATNEEDATVAGNHNGSGEEHFSEQVAHLLQRTKYVSSARELQGYMLLGAHQPR